ncbi:MAG TPA: Plug domain-containing protein [Gemmatimonadaceae bacterium]
MVRWWTVPVACLAIVASERPGGAQDPVRRDSLADTTAARRDSLARDSLARAAAERARLERQRSLNDTIKAPIIPAHVPATLSVGPAWTWDRNTLPATGALTLGELLDRIPGVTSFRAGWISAPEMAALNGRFGRVRIFLDGIELDPLNARLNGQHDLSLVDFFQLEDATVEVGADELRVHLRNWRVRNTTPTTRIDIHTGDLQTNSYRGYYGKRFNGGQVLQLAGDHYATTDRRTGEAGDHTALWGRAGVARETWTADVSLLRSGRKFTAREMDGAVNPADTLPTMDGIWTVGLARLAVGDPARGPWLQALASTQSYSIRNPPLTIVDSIAGPGGGGPGGSPGAPDTLEVPNDTTRSRPQVVLEGGISRGPLRIVAAGRARRWRGDLSLSPALRVGYATGGLALSALGERSPLDSVQRLEGTALLNLGGRFAISGMVSRFTPIENADMPSSLGMRLEAGARAGRLWFTAGALRRDTAFLPSAIAFDTAFRAAAQEASNGLFTTLRGKFYRDVGLDVTAMRFPSAGVYRPQYETRARLYLDSDMRSRFPSGNLNILFAITHEYRSEALFPTATEVLESSQYRLWSAELEIRLLTATISFQYRNFLAQEYQQVPGFTMPSVTSIYGIRWTFIN